MINNDFPFIRGDLKITEYDERTKISTVVVDEKNIIVRDGVNTIPLALSPKTTNGKLGVIKFGNDVGNGTLLNPSKPQFEDGKTSQNVIYTVPAAKMNYVPDGNKLILSISMQGSEIVGSQDYIRYTSAAIYNGQGEMFSFKRFPFRVFSKYVRVNIEWVISVSSSEEAEGDGEVCPTLPSVTGVILEAQEATTQVGSTIAVRGFERMTGNILRVVPNGTQWTTSNPNITLSGGGNGSVIVSGTTVGSSYLTLKSGEYTASRLISVTSVPVIRALDVFTEDIFTEIAVGDQILVKASYIKNDTSTNVSTTAVWNITSNLEIVSKTSAGLLVKVIAAGEVEVSATYEDLFDRLLITVPVPLEVRTINITPLGNTRFDIGESLDITPTIYFNDGTTRLATINDRWVYDFRAITLEEVGTVGNLRITALYRGEWNVRVYVGGVEGRLDFTIAQPIKVVDVYTAPQTPMYVIPNVYNSGRVMGVMSEGEDTKIDRFYVESLNNNLIIDEDGIKVINEGTYKMRVVIDTVDKQLSVISKKMTTSPLKLKMCSCDGVGSGNLKVTLVNPKAGGAYIDVSGTTRWFFDTSDEVTIDYYPDDEILIYGGVESLKLEGGINTIVDWGDFDCDGYEITSAMLIGVPYIAPLGVTTMDNMFNGCTLFNQNLNAWCVTDFPSKPIGFDTGCVSWTELRPEWGTCPTPTDVYKIIAEPSGDISLSVLEVSSLSVYGITRLDEKVTATDVDRITFEFDDSVIFISYTGEILEIEALATGSTVLKIMADGIEKSINVEVV